MPSASGRVGIPSSGRTTISTRSSRQKFGVQTCSLLSSSQAPPNFMLWGLISHPRIPAPCHSMSNKPGTSALLGASLFSWAISMPSFAPPVTSAKMQLRRCATQWIYSACQTNSDCATDMDVEAAIGLGA